MKDPIEAMQKKLKRKQIGSPTGLEPPSLACLIDRTLFAVNNPGSYTTRYLEILREDLGTVKTCVAAIEFCLDYKAEGDKKTLLEARYETYRRGK
jgi:hypothetical protein